MLTKYAIDGKEKEMMDRLLNYKQFSNSSYIADKTLLNKKSTALKHIPETKLTIENGWLQGRFITGKVDLGYTKLKEIVSVYNRHQYLNPFIELHNLLEKDQIKIKDRRKRVSNTAMFVYRIKRDKETFANLLLRYLTSKDWQGFIEFTESDYGLDNQKILKQLQKEYESIVKDPMDRQQLFKMYLSDIKGFKTKYEKHRKIRKAALNPKKESGYVPYDNNAAGGLNNLTEPTIPNISHQTTYYKVNIPTKPTN